jgi:hypothetical protein
VALALRMHQCEVEYIWASVSASKSPCHLKGRNEKSA